MDLPAVGNLGQLLNGGDPTAVFQAQRKGVTEPVLAKPLLNLQALLGGEDGGCLKLCPQRLANPDVKCVDTGLFPGYDRCYQINSKNIYIWPCTNEQ